MTISTAKRVNARTKDTREEIIEIMMGLAKEDGTQQIMPGLTIARSSKPSDTMCNVLKPSFCFVAQGSKRALLGESIISYDPMNYLIFTIDLPLSFQIRDATEEKPYLGFGLELDPAIVASVLMESGLRIKKGETSVSAMNAAPINLDMLDAIARLVRVAESEEDHKVLFPLVVREIVYRLLSGGQGARLSQLLVSTETQRISKAIGQLRENFDRHIRIENVASEIGMSVSSFHQHFKNVTSMSPLQFQKQLRLQEARRLMFGEGLDAATAGFRVGYDDPSYFSRDYKKQFGEPPQRDIANLKRMVDRV